MKHLRSKLAILAAVFAIPFLGTAASAQVTDVVITDPGIGIIFQQGHPSLIRLHVTETTNITPQKFTMLITLYRWSATSTKPQEYKECGPDHVSNCVWTKTKGDLATPGHSKVWNWYGLCRTGRYYFKLVAAAVSDTGQAQHWTRFYPYGGKNGDDSSIRPTRKQSHLISTCT
jgi:hypothetical protein